MDQLFKNTGGSGDKGTDALNMEEQLRQSQARYQAAFTYTGTAMLVVEEDRTIAMANHEAEVLTGYTADEVEGKRRWDEFVHPDDLERMLKYHAERREGDKAPNRYEFRLIHKDGSIKNVLYTIGLIPGTSQSIGSMIDITERIKIEKALRQTIAKNQFMLETLEDGFFEVDMQGNMLTVNEALCRDLGYPRNEVLKMNYINYVDKENAKKVYAAFNKVFVSGQHHKGYSWEFIRKDGTRGTTEVSISLLRDENGETTGFCGTARNITERVAMEEKLRYLSMHDALTGLYNRAYLEEEMARLGSSRSLPMSILSLDLNGLKAVNDNFGHKAGDELLVAAANLIKRPFRTSDVVARVGGDEFLVILPNTPGQAAELAAGRIRSEVALYNQGSPPHPISLAIGWATCNGEPASISDTFTEADNKMYQDKMLSRHRGGAQPLDRRPTLLAR